MTDISKICQHCLRHFTSKSWGQSHQKYCRRPECRKDREAEERRRRAERRAKG